MLLVRSTLLALAASIGPAAALVSGVGAMVPVSRVGGVFALDHAAPALRSTYQNARIESEDLKRRLAAALVHGTVLRNRPVPTTSTVHPLVRLAAAVVRAVFALLSTLVVTAAQPTKSLAQPQRKPQPARMYPHQAKAAEAWLKQYERTRDLGTGAHIKPGTDAAAAEARAPVRVAGGATMEERSAAWLAQYERTRELGTEHFGVAVPLTVAAKAAVEPSPSPVADAAATEVDRRWQAQGLAASAKEMREKEEVDRFLAAFRAARKSSSLPTHA